MKELRVILLEIDLISIGFLPIKTCVIFILREVRFEQSPILITKLP